MARTKPTKAYPRPRKMLATLRIATHTPRDERARRRDHLKRFGFPRPSPRRSSRRESSRERRLRIRNERKEIEALKKMKAESYRMKDDRSDYNPRTRFNNYSSFPIETTFEEHLEIHRYQQMERELHMDSSYVSDSTSDELD